MHLENGYVTKFLGVAGRCCMALSVNRLEGREATRLFTPFQRVGPKSAHLECRVGASRRHWGDADVANRKAQKYVHNFVPAGGCRSLEVKGY